MLIFLLNYYPAKNKENRIKRKLKLKQPGQQEEKLFKLGILINHIGIVGSLLGPR
jgi:hypothetical protein